MQELQINKNLFDLQNEDSKPFNVRMHVQLMLLKYSKNCTILYALVHWIEILVFLNIGSASKNTQQRAFPNLLPIIVFAPRKSHEESYKVTCCFHQWKNYTNSFSCPFQLILAWITFLLIFAPRKHHDKSYWSLACKNERTVQKSSIWKHNLFTSKHEFALLVKKLLVQQWWCFRCPRIRKLSLVVIFTSSRAVG